MALQQGGTDLGKVVGEMQERQNVDMLFRAETAVKTDYVAFENSVRARKGQSAWGAAQETAKWWDDKLREHSDNLENDAQRRVFSQSVAKLRVSSLNSVAGYEAEQRRLSLEASAQSSIVSSINLAAAEASNALKYETGSTELSENVTVTKDAEGNETATVGPVTISPGRQGFDISQHKNEILKRTQVLAELNGWAPEVREAKEAEYLTQLHKQVLQARVDKDPAGAKAYFEANKAEINGSDHDAIEKVLKTAGLKETAQTFADEVEQGGMSESNAITMARQNFSGEEEAAVVQEIKTRFREHAEAKDLAQRKAGDEAWDIFAKTKRLSAIPAATLNAMDGKVRLALEKEAKDMASGAEVKTDSAKYYELRQLMRDDPAAFAKRDLRQDFPFLSRGDREEFIKLQTDPNNMKDAATLDQQLSNTHDLLKWDSGDREKKGAFDSAVTKAINEEQKRLGKKLNFDERQQIIDRMVIEGEVVTGGLYDPDRRYFQVYGTEDAARFEPSVPKDERAKIEAALKRAGRPVNDAAVLQLYKRKHGL